MGRIREALKAGMSIIELKKLPYVEDVKTEYINESISDYSADDAFQMTLTLKYDDPKKDVESEEAEPENTEDNSESSEETEIIDETNGEDTEEAADEGENDEEAAGDETSEGGVE